MKLSDAQRWVLAFVIVLLACSLTVCLCITAWVTAPPLTADNCDMHVVAGRFIVCH